MAKPVPVDVTDQLRKQGHLVGDDYNDNDRVYELDGVKVKVKTSWQTHRMGLRTPHDGPDHLGTVEVVWVTGAVVGDDGKALRLENDLPAVSPTPHQCLQKHDTVANWAHDIEVTRFGCVEEVVRAWRARQQLAAVNGVRRVNGI